MSKSLNILIISFYFPPYKAVGGRRWAKHSKYLSKMGINTHVLTREFINSSSSWDKDVLSFSDHITRLKLKEYVQPYFKRQLPRGLIDKLKWKLSFWNWELQKRFLKGNIHDISRNTVNDFYEAAEKNIISNSIDTVILSVGPFHYSEVLVLLKQKFPHIKYIIDYRDYWEDSLVSLTSWQVEFEKKLQRQVIDTVDLILSPNWEMQKHYESTFKVKSYCLPHCYDPEDFSQIKSASIEPRSDIKLIYGGAFYAGIEENILLIKDFVNQLSKINSVSAEFFVSIKGYEEELSHPLIKRFDFIDSAEYFQKIANSDFVILILPSNRVNAMSSKFFELVAMKKPILYFGKCGDVSDYLIQHGLGFHITAENCKDMAQLVIENSVSKSVPNLNYDISKHGFEYCTKLLVDELNCLLNNGVSVNAN